MARSQASRILLVSALLALGLAAPPSAQTPKTLPPLPPLPPPVFDPDMLLVDFNQVRTQMQRVLVTAGGDDGEEHLFGRWETFWKPRVGPSGRIPDFRQIYQSWKAHRNPTELLGPTPPLPPIWRLLGPTQLPADARDIGSNSPGMGRVNTIAFAPGVLWIGTAAGGLWKSVDDGATWSNVFLEVPFLGISDIAIDPTNPAVMYLATGDGEGGDTPSFGVFKSTDGGQSFQETGQQIPLAFNLLHRIVVSPANPNLLLVASSFGIFRSLDGGASWTSVQGGEFLDLELKPDEPERVYASTRSQIFSSFDGGATWSLAFTAPASGRIALAVTPVNSQLVYAALARDGGEEDPFAGLYLSADSGVTWSLKSDKPNILGYSRGQVFNQRGQGLYDLALAASPTDPGEVWIGGINLWKSEDGGKNWTKKTHWRQSTLARDFIHADQHALAFSPGSGTRIYACNDGGVFRSTDAGDEWTDLSATLSISQFYTVAAARGTSRLLLGAQDNGVLRYNGTLFTQIYGADGIDGIVSPADPDRILFSIQNARIFRSKNGGDLNVTANREIPKADRQDVFEAPLVMHPTDEEILFFGLDDLWTSTNGGKKWKELSRPPGTNRINSIAIAPSNPSIVYVGRPRSMARSSDGGKTWTDRTAGLPFNLASLTDVAVDPSFPDRVWVTFSGFVLGEKVYRTVNGGASWTNISGSGSTGLSILPVNTILRVSGINGRVYVGTDDGVYFTDDALAPVWRPHTRGLPLVVVKDLELYPDRQKLLAATFGRGLWEGNLAP